ncbi:MAG: CARDB domain protein, partial [Actinomycetota bacterium]
ANPNTQSKPDLVIEWAKIRLGEVCRSLSPVLYATVKVKNAGTAASSARSDVGLVGAMAATGSGWGNGLGLPALSPGASYTATIPIYYLIDNPAYMPGRHEFEMQVNSGFWIEELDTSNNRYGPVSIEIPTGFCGTK